MSWEKVVQEVGLSKLGAYPVRLNMIQGSSVSSYVCVCEYNIPHVQIDRLSAWMRMGGFQHNYESMKKERACLESGS